MSKNSHLSGWVVSRCVVPLWGWVLALVLFTVVPWLLFNSSASCWSSGVGVSGRCEMVGVGGGVWGLSSSLSSLKWYSSLAIRCALRCCVAVSSKSLFREVLEGIAQHVMSVNHVLKFSFFLHRLHLRHWWPAALPLYECSRKWTLAANSC